MNKNEEKVYKAFDTLKAGVLDMIQKPEKLEKTMEHYGKHRKYNRYSGQNTILLMLQTQMYKGKPFMMARGFKQWKNEFNRTVNKGEKAMTILAPNLKTIVTINDKTGEEEKRQTLMGFRAINVFELSQTSGEPVPQPTEDHEYKSLHELKAEDFAKACPVPVEFVDMVGSSGYTDGKRIYVATHNNDLGRICTIFHELAHYNLHFTRTPDGLEVKRDDSLKMQELEAEAVAYMVSSAVGIENEFSKKYISNWNKGNDDIGSEFESRCLKLLNEALGQIDVFIGLVEA